MKTKIELRKSNGEGFKSKNSASNAFKKFKDLNITVLIAQKFFNTITQLEDNTYCVEIEPETDTIWAYILKEDEKVLYRTVSDLKYDRPMLDGRPQTKTEREKALEAELEAVKAEQSPDLQNRQAFLGEDYIGENYYDPFKEIEELKKELEEVKASPSEPTTTYEMVMEDDEDGLEAMAQAFEDYKREMEEKVSKLNQELAQAKAEVEQAKEEGRKEILTQVLEWTHNGNIRDEHFYKVDVQNIIDDYKEYSSVDFENLDTKKAFENSLRIDLAVNGYQLGLEDDQYLLDIDEAFKIILEANKPLTDNEKKELDASFDANDEPVECFGTTNITLAEGTELTVDDLF